MSFEYSLVRNCTGIFRCCNLILIQQCIKHYHLGKMLTRIHCKIAQCNFCIKSKVSFQNYSNKIIANLPGKLVPFLTVTRLTTFVRIRFLYGFPYLFPPPFLSPYLLYMNNIRCTKFPFNKLSIDRFIMDILLCIVLSS